MICRHVYPVSEDGEHLHRGCPCDPVIEEGGSLVIHNRLDGLPNDTLTDDGWVNVCLTTPCGITSPNSPTESTHGLKSTRIRKTGTKGNRPCGCA